MKQSLDIEQRVALSLVIQRHLRATEQFEQALREFNESCQAVRKALPAETRVVANINHHHYLVTSDKEGNFNIEKMDTL